jgi:psiF repeat
MKQTMTLLAFALAVLAGPVLAADPPKGAAACEAQATEKKLAGAAKNSFMKKCVAEAKPAATAAAASPECEKSAAEKKLAGAAKSSHIKKCMADAKKS